jgi:hypothetical protein
MHRFGMCLQDLLLRLIRWIRGDISSSKTMKAIRIVVAVVIVVAVTAVIVPRLMTPRTISSRHVCAANLVAIKQLKVQWAGSHSKGEEDEPTWKDLFGTNWASSLPTCPNGGKYRIGKIKENPTCSIGAPGHVCDR